MIRGVISAYGFNQNEVYGLPVIQMLNNMSLVKLSIIEYNTEQKKKMQEMNRGKKH